MMVKLLSFLFIFFLQSCVQQQQTISDTNQVAKKFDVDDQENYILFEGRTLEIVDININKTSQELSENVTYSCYYDQVVNNIVLNTTLCSSLPGLVFDTSEGTISWNPGYDNYSSDQFFEFKVIADDGLFSDSETFVIKLVDQNRAPTLPFLVQSQVDEEATLNLDFYDSVTVSDIDPDGDAVFYGCEYEYTPEKYANLTSGQVSAIKSLRALVDASSTQAQYDANLQVLLNYVSNFTSTTPAVWFSCSVLDGFSFNSLTGALSWTPNKNAQNEDKVYRIRITATDGIDQDINYYSILVKDINTDVEMTAFSSLDTYSFSDVIYTYEKVAIEPIRFSTKINLSPIAGTSSSYNCYFDTTIDGAVANTLPCTMIGITFNTDLDRFEYDGSVNSPSSRYEIKLTRSSESAIYVVENLKDVERLDDDGDLVKFTCFYDTTVDGSVADTNLCSDIGVDLNTNTGVFQFFPAEVSSDTSYEFKVVVSDNDSSDNTIFSVVVRNKSRLEFKEIDFGANHACAISMAHEIFCWGDNTYGQLGTGDNIYRRFPLKLTVDNSNSIRFRKLKTFNNHTCALSFEGDLYCWGQNDKGQLGTGDTNNKNLLQKVDFPASNSRKTVFDFAVGFDHTCVINSATRVFCFGSNANGQLGIGSSPDLDEIGLVSVSFSNFQYRNVHSIEAGRGYTCAKTGNGYLYCWGKNDVGQLGIGNTIDQSTPKLVTSSAFKFDLGEAHGCYIDDDFIAYCWGDNSLGQLGDGTNTDSDTPISFHVGTYQVKNIKLGSNHTCFSGIDAAPYNDDIYCFGSGTNGQLGDGGASNENAPVEASGTDGLVNLFVGNETNCLLVETGMKCWGNNGNHQFLTGGTTNFTTPANVSLENLGVTEDYIVSVNIGERTCFTKMSGEAYCTDLANDLNSALEQEFNLFPPINDRYFKRVMDYITPGSSNGIGLYVTRDGNLNKYGANDTNYWDGSGTGFINYYGTPIVLADYYQSYTQSSEHICAYDSSTNDTLTCSGENSNGELANGASSDAFGQPSLISAVKVVSGKDHTCALTALGAIYCSGAGAEIGQGSAGTATSFTLIDTSDYIDLYFIDIFAGDDMTCALSDKRELYCFGDYYDDEPVTKVSLASGVYLRDIKISASHFCALSFDGETYCWGDNSSGQLGIGSTTNQVNPARITLALDPVNKYFDISVNDQNTCAINFQGKLYCWGENGQRMRFTNLNSNQDYLSPQAFVGN